MARASYLVSARAMALGAPPLAWFCAATWPVFTPPLTWQRGSLQTGYEFTDQRRYLDISPVIQSAPHQNSPVTGLNMRRTG